MLPCASWCCCPQLFLCWPLHVLLCRLQLAAVALSAFLLHCLLLVHCSCAMQMMVDILGVVTEVRPLGSVKRKTDQVELSRRDVTLVDKRWAQSHKREEHGRACRAARWVGCAAVPASHATHSFTCRA